MSESGGNADSPAAQAVAGEEAPLPAPVDLVFRNAAEGRLPEGGASANAQVDLGTCALRNPEEQQRRGDKFDQVRSHGENGFKRRA